MRVQVHTKFCFLCVLTFLFHQCNHCHEEGHDGHQHHDERRAHSDLQISEAPYVSAATGSPVSTNVDGDALEQEQRYYIQELFRRYGKRDRLDFQGFQTLLLSLGLGEVKLVSVDHEDLGHDHVAHLDVLEVQEGYHSHSKTSDYHSKGHGHAHGHPHHKTGSRRSQAEPGPTPCSKTTTEHEHGHSHENHSHHSDGHVHGTQDHHGSHDHLREEGSGPKHSDEKDIHDHGHGQIHQHDPSSETHSDHDDHSDHDQNGIHQVHTATDITAINRDQSAHPETSRLSLFPPSTPAPTESRTRRPRKPMRERVNRKRNKTPSPFTPSSDIHNHNSNHSHSHKEKRETPRRDISPTPPETAVSGHSGGLSHQHEECLNITELLNYYGLSPDSLISPKQFTYLCPALLYQIDSRVCIRHYHQRVEQEPLEPINPVLVWVWGFVSITIISLLSLLGVVLVPILKQSCFKFLLTFLVALAVGTLSGDALLHLMPHSQGQHDHSTHTINSDTDMMKEFDGVWKGLTALTGIYLLFIIEHCIGMFKHYKDQAVARKAREEAKIGRKLSDHKLNRRSDAEWLHLKPLGEDPEVSCDNGHNDTQLTEFQTPDSPTNKMQLAAADVALDRSPIKENGRKAKAHRHSHGHGHSHGGNCHSDQEMKDAGIASIAWMVIMGDGMHNFSDGLAIGAAFSATLTGGISTSVAVFCHELPHELGDFAVLLKAGMSVRQAIVYNLLSALMAYAGMIIGTAVGQYTQNVTSWIFAITAGMFLYVALVDMLPEMLHGDSEDHKRCQLGHFFLQNLGMLTGFGIMLLIAIFEEQIVFDFGF